MKGGGRRNRFLLPHCWWSFIIIFFCSLNSQTSVKFLAGRCCAPWVSSSALLMVVITTAACCVRRAGAHFIFIVFIMLGPLQGREPIFSPLLAAAAASGGVVLVPKSQKKTSSNVETGWIRNSTTASATLYACAKDSAFVSAAVRDADAACI